MASTGADAEILRKGMAPVSGMSSAGVPLSENRQPAEDLRPWVARLVAAKIHTPPGTKIACGMCNDLVYVRTIFNAKWSAETLDGHGEYEREALLFGQHSKFMPLTCEGDIMSAGFGLRAGAFYALFGRSAHDIVDRIEQNDLFGLMGSDFRDILTDQHSPEEWNLAMEEAIRRVITKLDPEPPNPISTDFELAAFADPSLVLADFAEDYGISLRKLERLVKRDFGMPPKKVLRRARALDFAAQLCGVADDEEEEEMILRYFDQSHMIREFAKFFGFTPREFRSVPRPLLTITLEQRQARRLEELQRLPEGAPRPWHAKTEQAKG